MTYYNNAENEKKTQKYRARNRWGNNRKTSGCNRLTKKLQTEPVEFSVFGVFSRKIITILQPVMLEARVKQLYKKVVRESKITYNTLIIQSTTLVLSFICNLPG